MHFPTAAYPPARPAGRWPTGPDTAGRPSAAPSGPQPHLRISLPIVSTHIPKHPPHPRSVAQNPPLPPSSKTHPDPARPASSPPQFPPAASKIAAPPDPPPHPRPNPHQTKAQSDPRTVSAPPHAAPSSPSLKPTRHW